MKISVLTPSYNSALFLEKAIQSVLEQEDHDFEHIIMDAGSKDGTLEVLKKYQHLKWESRKDKGQSDAMNKAFKRSDGEIIVYLNADDYFLPGAFQIIRNCFNEHLDIQMVVGNLYIIDEKGLSRPSINVTTKYDDLKIINKRFPLNPVSYFYKRELQLAIGDFPVNEHYTMDYWFLLRAFHKFKVLQIEDFLGCFVFSLENKTALIDSFNRQRSLSLKYQFWNDPKSFFSSAKKLYAHKRSNSLIKKFYFKIKGNKV